MQTILGILVRHALAAVAGILAAKSGGADPAALGSALTLLATIGWSLIQKHNAGITINPFG